MPSASYGLRLPASASCLERHARLAGRCPNNSSLFPPLAAVVVVAGHIQRNNYFNFTFGATAFAERSVAIEAPVGLLSGRAVCVSRWRGFAPTSSAERDKRIFLQAGSQRETAFAALCSVWRIYTINILGFTFLLCCTIMKQVTLLLKSIRRLFS